MNSGSVPAHVVVMAADPQRFISTRVVEADLGSALSQARPWRACTAWQERTWPRWRLWCSVWARPASPSSFRSHASLPPCEDLWGGGGAGTDGWSRRQQRHFWTFFDLKVTEGSSWTRYHHRLSGIPIGLSVRTCSCIYGTARRLRGLRLWEDLWLFRKRDKGREQGWFQSPWSLEHRLPFLL